MIPKQPNPEEAASPPAAAVGTGVAHGTRPAQERRQWRCHRREGGEVGLPLRSSAAEPFWPKLRVIAADLDFGIRRHRRSLSKIEVFLIFSMPNSPLPLSSPSRPAIGAHQQGTRVLRCRLPVWPPLCQHGAPPLGVPAQAENTSGSKSTP
ncbi:Os01g0175800 [Oryza sativa Japonica Group]|nr:Os01g0175800 [Oryza sativa Japonica Group]